MRFVRIVPASKINEIRFPLGYFGPKHFIDSSLPYKYNEYSNLQYDTQSTSMYIQHEKHSRNQMLSTFRAQPERNFGADAGKSTPYRSAINLLIRGLKIYVRRGRTIWVPLRYLDRCVRECAMDCPKCVWSELQESKSGTKRKQPIRFYRFALDGYWIAPTAGGSWVVSSMRIISSGSTRIWIFNQTPFAFG